MRAQIFYDFNMLCWVASVQDPRDSKRSFEADGSTPQEAVDELRKRLDMEGL